MRILLKILTRARQEGPLFWVGRLKQAVRSALKLQTVIFYRAGSAPAETGALRELETSLCGPLQAHASFPWTDFEVLRERFAAGHRLFTLHQDGVPVSFGWVSQQRSFPIGELGGEVSLEKEALWIWDCVTPPELRGYGYYPELLRQILAKFGPDQAVIYCRAENKSSIRGIIKAGFRPWFQVTVCRWGARVRKLQDFPGIHKFRLAATATSSQTGPAAS